MFKTDDIKPVSIKERIKLMFVKTRYKCNLEDGTEIKYKIMDGKLYILKITYIWKVG